MQTKHDERTDVVESDMRCARLIFPKKKNSLFSDYFNSLSTIYNYVQNCLLIYVHKSNNNPHYI